jgi:hypothetical protein
MHPNIIISNIVLSTYIVLSHPCTTLRSATYKCTLLMDDEFLRKYRMHHSSFCHLLSLIDNHPAFLSNGHKKQEPVNYNLRLLYSTWENLAVVQNLRHVIKWLVLVRGHASSSSNKIIETWLHYLARQERTKEDYKKGYGICLFLFFIALLLLMGSCFH